MKKILIICAGLCLGGVERFAANISLFAPPGEFIFHYLVFDNSARDFEAEVVEKGATIIRVASPIDGHFAYIIKLFELIRKNRYDVIHSHTQFNSGINLLVGKLLGVPIRIAHSHTTAHEHPVPLLKALYENIMRVMVRRCATHFLACGEEAGKWMYGNHKYSIIRNGINTELFAFSEDNRHSVREQYLLSDDAFVIGHTGTLSKLKNQEYLIDLLPEILRIKPGAMLLLVGRGSEETVDYLRKKAADHGIDDKVIIAGPTLSVYEYLSAMDTFAFPSLREGTPLALLEAQANGLPCVISSAVPSDAMITELAVSLPLADRNAWIKALTKTKRNHPELYAEKVDCLGYGCKTAMEPLYEIYKGR